MHTYIHTYRSRRKSGWLFRVCWLMESGSNSVGFPVARRTHRAETPLFTWCIYIYIHIYIYVHTYIHMNVYSCATHVCAFVLKLLCVYMYEVVMYWCAACLWSTYVLVCCLLILARVRDYSSWMCLYDAYLSIWLRHKPVADTHEAWSVTESSYACVCVCVCKGTCIIHMQFKPVCEKVCVNIYMATHEHVL